MINRKISGQVVQLDIHCWSGIITDENEQELCFDLSEWIDGLYVGAKINFELVLCDYGLTPVHLALC